MALGLFSDENAQAQDQLMRGTPLVPTPGMFTGVGTGAALGLGEGAMKVVEPLAGVDMTQALSPSPDFYTPAEPTHEGYSADPRYTASQLVRQFRADPMTVGLAGQMLHGVASFGERALAGATVAGPLGAFGLVGGTEAYSYYQEHQDEFDPKTLKQLTVANGLMSGGMAVMPASVPGKMLVRLASGATINVGIGGLERFATHTILENAGYPEQARQYRVLDGQAAASDAILGAFFGAAFGHRPQLPDEVVDAAQVAADASQVETQLAPGVPKTAQDRNRHVTQLQDTVTAVSRGEDAPPVEHVDTVPNPAQDALRAAADKEAASAIKEQGVSLSELPEPSAKDLADRLQELQDEIRQTREENQRSQLSRAGRQEKAKAEAEKRLAEADTDVQEAAGQADSVLQRNEGMRIEHIDDDGNRTMVDARQALQNALAESADAPQEGVFMQVAAACFGRGP